jgi:hypothetical protein
VADNLGVQFFIDAKSQYAGKWRWVVVALLAYVHLGLVVPFTARTLDKAAVDRQLADNRKVEEALKPVAAAADIMVKNVNEAKDGVAAKLKTDLVERFQELSRAVRVLAALDPSQAEGPRGEALFNPAQQVPHLLPPMPPELRRQIAMTARNAPQEMPPEREAYIDEAIAPAFEHANQRWAASGLSTAKKGVATIQAEIVKAKAAAPATAAVLDGLGKSLEALGTEAQGLIFAPPANSAWWQSVSSKEASILSMTSDLAARVGDFSTSETALQTLSAHINDIVRRNQEAATDLNGTLAELNKRAADLQSQLGEIEAPLKVVSFKLSDIAPLMPLIIAAAIAVMAALTADGLRCITLAAELVGSEAERTAIRKWLHATVGTRARVARSELAVTIAAAAWVLTAARQVAALPPSFLPQPILAAIAVVVVVVARVYRWHTAYQAVSV